MAGKEEYLGYGLPTEGTEADGPTAGRLASEDVVTAGRRDPVGALREQVAASPYPLAVVLSGTGVVLGRVASEALEAGSDRPVEAVMEPGPTTMRPHLDLEAALQRLRRNDLQHGLVTTPNGKLVGVIARAEVERRLDGPG